jgi:hypothetical protein
MQKTNAMLADDVESYHDLTGFHIGGQVRADFERLELACPRTKGAWRVEDQPDG